MSSLLTLTEANPGMEPRNLRLEQFKRRQLDGSVTTPTHYIVQRRHMSFKNGSHTNYLPQYYHCGGLVIRKSAPHEEILGSNPSAGPTIHIYWYRLLLLMSLAPAR